MSVRPGPAAREHGAARAAAGTAVPAARGEPIAQGIARWRIRNQHLAAPQAESASVVVRNLLAVQAENRGQAEWAVACRTVRRDPTDLADLLERGEVIRTHVLRPTWHFVAAADAVWLLELTAPRVRPVFLRQLTQLHGWAPKDVDRAITGIVDSLSARPDQTREQLAQELGERGVTAAGQPLTLLLGVAELERLVCSGRSLNGDHTYALLAERVPRATRLDRDQALAEITWRYLTGHGPATERDLAYWATLRLTDVRRGIEHSRDRLSSFDHDGRTFWHARDTAAPPRAQEPRGHLLQILDETYRGYQDSRMLLDAGRIVPPGRETALGMAVVDAQLVGRMQRTVGSSVRFEVTPYRPLGPSELDALEDAAARYGEFLGRAHRLHVRQ